MTFFAIRRKADGAFMPVLAKRGQTRAEPAKGAAPRLFTRRQDAAAALDWWAKGVWKMSRRGGVNMFSGEDDYFEELIVQKIDGRNSADFDIVTVKLTVRAENNAHA